MTPEEQYAAFNGMDAIPANTTYNAGTDGPPVRTIILMVAGSITELEYTAEDGSTVDYLTERPNLNTVLNTNGAWGVNVPLTAPSNKPWTKITTDATAVAAIVPIKGL